MFGIKGFAKGLAKAQLRSFLSFRNKYPEMRPEELYLQAIKMRPGYDEGAALDIVNYVKDASERTGLPFNFQQVVILLAEHEFSKRTGHNLRPVERMKLINAVKDIVPINL